MDDLLAQFDAEIDELEKVAAPSEVEPPHLHEPPPAIPPPPHAASSLDEALYAYHTVSAPAVKQIRLVVEPSEEQQEEPHYDQQAHTSLPPPPMPPPNEPPPAQHQNKTEKKGKHAASRPANGKGLIMQAAGKRWLDPTLNEWPPNDFRVFVGNLGNEVNEELLNTTFSRYPSFAMSKVLRDHKGKTKGFGFVSFLDSADMAKAIRDIDGEYIGQRPCKLSKSSWDDRVAKKKQKR